MNPDDWSRWRQEIFGDPYLIWHDGPNFAAMLAAARRDRALVARMLQAGLAAEDPVAAQGLAELADAGLAPRDAANLLRRHAGTANGVFLIRVAEALHVLTGDRSWAARIAEVLRCDNGDNGDSGYNGDSGDNSDSEFVRLQAAIALAEFPPVAVAVAALTAAVTDPAYLVRYHAATTLVRYAGGLGGFADGPGLFAKITSDDPGLWRAAAAELAAHVRS